MSPQTIQIIICLQDVIADLGEVRGNLALICTSSEQVARYDLAFTK